jgi:putative chitinase
MCIIHSVGVHGTNQFTDVKMVQALLNENLERLDSTEPLEVDGHIGKGTNDRIGEFQSQVMKMAKPDKKVDVGGHTLDELRAGLTADLTQNKMKGIMPRATDALLDRYYVLIVDTMHDYEINTPLRIAHFLAQVGVECGDLRWMQELDSGAYLNGNDDLGNTEDGDGPRFKGRGLLQLTGRSNYTAYGEYCDRDFLSDTTSVLIATDASFAVDSAGWYWTTLKKVNPLADADNVHAVTHKVNGGYNDLEERKAHLRRAKCLLVL